MTMHFMSTKSTQYENLRLRMPTDVKHQFDQLLEKKRITQQAALTSLVQHLLKQDDYMQSVMLGQISDKTAQEISQMLLAGSATNYNADLSLAASKSQPIRGRSGSTGKKT